MTTKEITDIIQIAFRSEKLNFFKRAYRERGKEYNSWNFLKDIIASKWNITFSRESYDSPYSISIELSNNINETNIDTYFEICFHMFCKVSMLVIDRRVKNKLKHSNKDLLNKITEYQGKASYMKVLKNMFVELGKLPKDFKFGDKKFYSSIAKGYFL